MAKIIKAASEADFRHNTTTGPNGEVLYDCPLEIQNQADLDAYGITWDDCRTLNFHGSEKVTVYFMKVESRELAEYQWAYLDSRHSRGFANARCKIPGTRKPWVRCPDTVSCAKCPHKANRKPPFISWDRLVTTGYEPVAGAPADEQAIARIEYQALRTLMDAEDTRIARAFEMKELMGYKADEITVDAGDKEPAIDFIQSALYSFVATGDVVGGFCILSSI